MLKLLTYYYIVAVQFKESNLCTNLKNVIEHYLIILLR